jgi:lipopolysaccharide/colanic/teichoic acid biosynthesis glycosyltransferase
MSRVLADEFKAWSPWIVERLVRRAVARLPDEFKDRYDEEWRGHLNAIPGELGRLVTAFGLVIAADRISYGPWTRDRRLKTAFDKIAAVLSICFWAPLLLLLALVIKAESKGSVLVRQRCYGLRNRTFFVLRFRTTYAERDGQIEPQVTVWGRLLRRTSLDELPQLFNILRGDMSLVGPQPEPEGQPNSAIHRNMKPGLTGLAQIENCETSHDRERHDLEYIKNWSFWLDLKIIARTVGVILTSRAGGRRHNRRDPNS